MTIKLNEMGARSLGSVGIPLAGLVLLACGSTEPAENETGSELRLGFGEAWIAQDLGSPRLNARTRTRS